MKKWVNYEMTKEITVQTPPTLVPLVQILFQVSQDLEEQRVASPVPSGHVPVQTKFVRQKRLLYHIHIPRHNISMKNCICITQPTNSRSLSYGILVITTVFTHYSSSFVTHKRTFFGGDVILWIFIKSPEKPFKCWQWLITITISWTCNYFPLALVLP